MIYAPLPSIEHVKHAAITVLGISREALEGPSKVRKVIRPRHIAMYLSRELTGKSFPQIGRNFGDRDHTTILYAHRKISRAIGSDQALADDVQRVVLAIEENRI